MTANPDEYAALRVALDETSRMLEYLWTAEGLRGFPVHSIFADSDPLQTDVPETIKQARAALSSTPASHEAEPSPRERQESAVEFEPNPEAVRRISRHLLGEDIRNVRAAIESFPNGFTIAPAPPASAELRRVVERVAALTEQDIRDYEQGLCFFCGEGWEWVPGPRGGKPKRVNTKNHAPDCTWVESRAALSSTPTPSPEIDVPRLARAIHVVDGKIAEFSPKLRVIADPKHDETRRLWAEAIAAAYRELQDEK